MRGGQGLPRASHSWFQTMDAPHDTAEPITKAGGTSMKTYLRRGRKCWRDRGGGNRENDRAIRSEK